MDATLIDKIPVSSLYPDRYGVGKTKVYAYLKTLGIEPFLDGRMSFITFDQLELLDAYCTRLRDGREAVESFLATLPQQKEQVHELVHKPVHESQQPWLAFVEAIANRLSQPSPDPLSLQRQLEEIALKQWIVSSSQLRQIMGIKPREGDRYGFQFVRVGRIGRESGWQVSKPSTAKTVPFRLDGDGSIPLEPSPLLYSSAGVDLLPHHTSVDSEV